MSSEFVIAWAAFWSAVIVSSVVAIRRSDRRWQERLREFDRAEAERDERHRRNLDEMDRRSEERAAENERREAERIAESEAAMAADDLEDEDDLDEPVDAELVITVRLPTGTSTDELADVVREVQSATRGRFPVHIGSPARNGY